MRLTWLLAFDARPLQIFEQMEREIHTLTVEFWMEITMNMPVNRGKSAFLERLKFLWYRLQRSITWQTFACHH